MQAVPVLPSVLHASRVDANDNDVCPFLLESNLRVHHLEVLELKVYEYADGLLGEAARHVEHARTPLPAPPPPRGGWVQVEGGELHVYAWMIASLRGQQENSILRVARSVWRRAVVARRVARSMSRYSPPAAPAGPATYKYPAGNGLRRVVPERRANLA